jgi:hypothetical protein
MAIANGQTFDSFRDAADVPALMLGRSTEYQSWGTGGYTYRVDARPVYLVVEADRLVLRNPDSRDPLSDLRIDAMAHSRDGTAGDCRTFGAYVLRVAATLGIRTFVIPPTAEAERITSYAPEGWDMLAADTVEGRLGWWHETFVKAHAPAESAVA